MSPLANNPRFQRLQRLALALGLALGTALWPGCAQADDAAVAPEAPEAPAAPSPGAAADELAGGQAHALRLGVEASLGAADPLTPTSITIDLWHRLSPGTVVGLTTSSEARATFGAGRGLCLGGGAACDHLLGGAAVDLRFALPRELRGRAAVDVARFAPTVIALELGARRTWAQGPWSASIEPLLRLGVARRDLANRDTGGLPVTIARALTAQAGGFVVARLDADLRDVFAAPTVMTGIGGYGQVGPLAVSARLGLVDALRASPQDRIVGGLYVGWRS